MQLVLFSGLSLRAITLTAMGEPGRKYTTAEVAESFNASHTYVSKAISRLVELGFLNAAKERSGDICLRDSAMDKSAGKSLYTLENNEVVDCIGTDYPLLPTCLLRGKLAAVQEAFFVTLGPVLVAGLISVKPIDGADGDIPEGDNVPKGSVLSVRSVWAQS